MRLLATAARGCSTFVADECRRLGLKVDKVRDDGVQVQGGWRELGRALVGLRTADRVLIHLGSSAAADGDELYEGARALDWARWLDATTTISVFATGPLPETSRDAVRPLRSHMYAGQRVKDAIVDALRHEHGRRPDVDPRDADARIAVRFSGARCGIFLDASGASLNRRGYRFASVKAPVGETLAASILMDAGYNGRTPLFDPLCGSGTLAIEAAMIAAHLAPGAERSFAVERWPLVREAAREALDGAREKARDRRRSLDPRDVAPIHASDHDPAAVDATRQNLKAAGLDRIVRVSVAEAVDLRAPNGAHIVCNPPYGERIGDDVLALYRSLGEAWSQQRGSRLTILDGHDGFVDAFGQPIERTTLFQSGRIPVRVHHIRLGAQPQPVVESTEQTNTGDAA